MVVKHYKQKVKGDVTCNSCVYFYIWNRSQLILFVDVRIVAGRQIWSKMWQHSCHLASVSVIYSDMRNIDPTSNASKLLAIPHTKSVF